MAVSAIPIVIAITFHEAAHGYVAYRLGDPTAKMLGRLTLNPIKHIDPFGTIIMPIMLLIFTQGQFVFGYAKPVPIGVRNFKDPRRDMAITGAAGPLTNVALALVSAWIFSAFILTRGIVPEALFMPVAEMLRASVYINVILAALNRAPLVPLKDPLLRESMATTAVNTAQAPNDETPSTIANFVNASIVTAPVI